MTVLITGGEGFIGRNLRIFLERKNLEVYSIDINSSNDYRVDIRDYNKLEKLFCRVKPDAVIHLAAIASVPQCEIEPRECFDVNVYGTFNVVKLSKEYGAKLVFASSAAVYGIPQIIPIPVTHPLNPINVYGLTKVLGETIVKNIMRENYVIFRIFNAYGEQCNRSYVIPDTIKKILSGLNPIPMKGTGNEERDFVYIEDVCEAFYVALGSNITGVFNLGSGTRIKIKDLVRIIAEIMNKRDLEFLFEGKPRIGDLPILHADVSEGNIIPGWKPKTDLRTGLRKTIEWYKSQYNYVDSELQDVE